MHREADAERERLYPLAHLRQKLESEEFLAAINKSGWKSNEGARGHQDDLPREPSLWKWCTHDLSMNIYHLMDATKVSRRTLLKFFCARGIKGHKKGRRTVYRAEEVRLAVREWLTNRHWHKKPEKQKEYLMHYLDGVACARSQDLPLELEFLEQATEQVISCDANFANWISDLNAEVVPHIKKPLLGLYDSLFGLDNYGSSENLGGNM